MKIVLTPKQVNEIIFKHLYTTGQLDCSKGASIYWNINQFDIPNAHIVVEQGVK